MQILQVMNYPFYKHIVIHKYVKHKLVTNVKKYIYIFHFMVIFFVLSYTLKRENVETFKI